MRKLDRQDRYFYFTNLINRLRPYTFDAWGDLFEAMGRIEKKRDLIPKLTEKEETAVAMYEERLARGEDLPELRQNYDDMPIEDFLPETAEGLAKRLSALSEDDRDSISGIITELIEIDESPYRMSPALIASLKHQMREIDAGRERLYSQEEVEEFLRET